MSEDTSTDTTTEIGDVQTQTTIQSGKIALAGLRDGLGTSLWLALLLDVLMLAAGTYAVVEYSGAVLVLGVVTLMIGLVGIVEKGYRRVNR